MSKLFIYYSFTGNVDIVAKELSEKGYTLRKVTEKKKMPKSFFWGVLAGGFRAGMNMKGKLIDYDKDVSGFDEIVIGSPIWNGRFPPAINAVLKETDLGGKKVSFVFCSGSGTGPKASEKAKELFNDPKIIFLKDPKKYGDELVKLNEL